MKTSEKYLKDNMDKEGCFHKTVGDFVDHLIGFCGCGCPEDARAYIKCVLEIFASGEGYWKRLESHFKSDGEKYFVYYFLADKDITEHGGSVPGWLTDKGNDVLELLREAEEEEKHTES